MYHSNTYKVFIGTVAFLVLFSSSAFAQDAILTSGGNGTSFGGSVSYSVGQVVYQFGSGSGGSVSQGVQQPYTVIDETSIKNNASDAKNISVFPNPVNDVLTVAIDNNTNKKPFVYRLYTLTGNLVETRNMQDSQTSINMEHLPSSMYILRIFQGTQEVKTYRIIKN